jgi:phytoene synthase
MLGLEMDLTGARYRTFDDLAVYCYRVAATIGLISIEIFGYANPQTREYATKLGTALQLVNILRDLQSDARRGRVYLPQEELERFGVEAQELADGCYSAAFVNLMSFQCERARHYFDSARRLLAPEDRRSMVAAEIMAAIYWRLLESIERRGYNVFGEGVRLSRRAKLWTALSVYLGAEWRK